MKHWQHVYNAGYSVTATQQWLKEENISYKEEPVLSNKKFKEKGVYINFQWRLHDKKLTLEMLTRINDELEGIWERC